MDVSPRAGGGAGPAEAALPWVRAALRPEDVADPAAAELRWALEWWREVTGEAVAEADARAWAESVAERKRERRRGDGAAGMDEGDDGEGGSDSDSDADGESEEEEGGEEDGEDDSAAEAALEALAAAEEAWRASPGDPSAALAYARLLLARPRVLCSEAQTALLRVLEEAGSLPSDVWIAWVEAEEGRGRRGAGGGRAALARLSLHVEAALAESSGEGGVSGGGGGEAEGGEGGDGLSTSSVSAPSASSAAALSRFRAVETAALAALEGDGEVAWALLRRAAARAWLAAALAEAVEAALGGSAGAHLSSPSPLPERPTEPSPLPERPAERALAALFGVASPLAPLVDALLASPPRGCSVALLELRLALAAWTRRRAEAARSGEGAETAGPFPSAARVRDAFRRAARLPLALGWRGGAWIGDGGELRAAGHQGAAPDGAERPRPLARTSTALDSLEGALLAWAAPAGLAPLATFASSRGEPLPIYPAPLALLEAWKGWVGSFAGAGGGAEGPSLFPSETMATAARKAVEGLAARLAPESLVAARLYAVETGAIGAGEDGAGAEGQGAAGARERTEVEAGDGGAADVAAVSPQPPPAASAAAVSPQTLASHALTAYLEAEAGETLALARAGPPPPPGAPAPARLALGGDPARERSLFARALRAAPWDAPLWAQAAARQTQGRWAVKARKAGKGAGGGGGGGAAAGPAGASAAPALPSSLLASGGASGGPAASGAGTLARALLACPWSAALALQRVQLLGLAREEEGALKAGGEDGGGGGGGGGGDGGGLDAPRAFAASATPSSSSCPSPVPPSRALVSLAPLLSPAASLRLSLGLSPVSEDAAAPAVSLALSFDPAPSDGAAPSASPPSAPSPPVDHAALALPPSPALRASAYPAFAVSATLAHVLASPYASSVDAAALALEALAFARRAGGWERAACWGGAALAGVAEGGVFSPERDPAGRGAAAVLVGVARALDAARGSRGADAGWLGEALPAASPPSRRLVERLFSLPRSSNDAAPTAPALGSATEEVAAAARGEAFTAAEASSFPLCLPAVAISSFPLCLATAAAAAALLSAPPSSSPPRASLLACRALYERLHVRRLGDSPAARRSVCLAWLAFERAHGSARHAARARDAVARALGPRWGMQAEDAPQLQPQPADLAASAVPAPDADPAAALVARWGFGAEADLVPPLVEVRTWDELCAAYAGGEERGEERAEGRSRGKGEGRAGGRGRGRTGGRTGGRGGARSGGVGGGAERPLAATLGAKRSREEISSSAPLSAEEQLQRRRERDPNYGKRRGEAGLGEAAREGAAPEGGDDVMRSSSERPTASPLPSRSGNPKKRQERPHREPASSAAEGTPPPASSVAEGAPQPASSAAEGTPQPASPRARGATASSSSPRARGATASSSSPRARPLPTSPSSSPSPSPSRAFVKYLAPAVDEEALRHLCERFGEVIAVRMARPKTRPDAPHRGFAYVDFASDDALEKARLALDKAELCGKRLLFARSDPPGAGGGAHGPKRATPGGEGGGAHGPRQFTPGGQGGAHGEGSAPGPSGRGAGPDGSSAGAAAGAPGAAPAQSSAPSLRPRPAQSSALSFRPRPAAARGRGRGTLDLRGRGALRSGASAGASAPGSGATAGASAPSSGASAGAPAGGSLTNAQLRELLLGKKQ